MRQHFDLAGAQLGIDHSLGTPSHRAGHPEHEFVAHPLGRLEGRGPVRMAHHLRQPLAVAQVDEDHAAVVAAPVRPAAQRDAAIDQRSAQLAAVMSPHLLVVFERRDYAH